MDGEALVYADSQWFYFDQGTGRPIKAKPEDVEPFGMGEPYPMEYTSRKLTYPEELEYRGTVRVCENHLDTNAHMNNGEYIRIAANFLPSGFSVGDLQVEYRLAAKLGEQIRVNTKRTEDGFYVVMTDTDGSPYAITRFRGM